MVDIPRHSVSASGILLDERRRVLVIQRRDNGNWEPPGGLLELDESIVHCLRREMREETGLSVAPVRLTGVYKNMRIGAVALVFRVRRLGGTLVTTDETADFAWWTEDDVRGKMREVYAARVLDALDAADPSVRAHDGVGLLAEDVPIEDPDRRQPTLD
ncbi:NUDIX hydrolase [Actinocatenispora comari]|uniref:NUDIX hydrolase n=1 Tax=Actinocatenispora comari TaxID=2807577 RepID=A0A8J4A913_9ACTN|nr:NUDIX hydrolase [Actinocatenispora comari]GIL26430.1 NUDIX hydrolase [Actinocatenispora comari]